MTTLATNRLRSSIFDRLFSTKEIGYYEPLLPGQSLTTASLPEAKSDASTITGPSTITTVSNGDLAVWLSVPQTTATEVTPLDQQMHRLMIAADAYDMATFNGTYLSIDWDKRDAEDHAQTVRLALQSGAHLIARELAQRGSDRFPDHIELQKMARILAPPKARSIPSSPDKTWTVNRAWLQNNREAYRGSWVALKNGELLAVANDIPGLTAIVGPIKGTNILVTPIW